MYKQKNNVKITKTVFFEIQDKKLVFWRLLLTFWLSWNWIF